MRLKQIAVAAALGSAFVMAPLAGARAQTPWCNPFPLTWPFCVVGAAATVATAPFRAIAQPYPAPYYYPPRYYRRYPYYGYYGYPYYYGR